MQDRKYLDHEDKAKSLSRILAIVGLLLAVISLFFASPTHTLAFKLLLTAATIVGTILVMFTMHLVRHRQYYALGKAPIKAMHAYILHAIVTVTVLYVGVVGSFGYRFFHSAADGLLAMALWFVFCTMLLRNSLISRGWFGAVLALVVALIAFFAPAIVTNIILIALGAAVIVASIMRIGGEVRKVAWVGLASGVVTVILCVLSTEKYHMILHFLMILVLCLLPWAVGTLVSWEKLKPASKTTGKREEKDTSKNAAKAAAAAATATAAAAAAEKNRQRTATDAQKAQAARAQAEKDAKAAKEKAEREAKAAKDKAEADAKAAKEKADREAKAAKEKAEAEAKAAKEKADREAQAAKEKAEAEAKAAKEKADAEAAKEKAAKEKAEAEAKAAKEKAEAEAKAAKEKAEAEATAAKEKAEADAKAAKEKAEAEAKAAKEKAEAEAKAAKEKMDKEKAALAAAAAGAAAVGATQRRATDNDKAVSDKSAARAKTAGVAGAAAAGTAAGAAASRAASGKGMNIDLGVTSGYKGKDLKKVLAAPVTALDGMSESQAKALKEAFGIDNVRELADNRFILWAQAICDMADREEDE